MGDTFGNSSDGDAHLGHVFNDDLNQQGCDTYELRSDEVHPSCEMSTSGYADYLYLFESSVTTPDKEIAYLAGGCFWGMEQIIRKIPGVLDTDVGYTGGRIDSPTYADVKSGTSGHAEAVRVTFDRNRLSYEELLDYFFRMHDPTTTQP